MKTGTSSPMRSKPRADRLAQRVAVVDALQDHGELEPGERRVPGDRRDVAARAGARTARSARRATGARRREAVVLIGESGRSQRHAVHHQQAQVGQRIAERGHLPVEDGLMRVVRRRSARCRAGSRRAPRRARGSGAARGRGPRAARRRPASSRLREASSCLPQRRSCRSRKPSGRPKSARPTSAGSTACSSTRVSTRPGSRPGCARAPSGASSSAVRYGVPVDELHDVEGRPEHLLVLAEQHAVAAPARLVGCSALITRCSRFMSCAVARTWPSGGRRTTHFASPSVTA